jgi:HlyD family secretion protein
MRLAKVMDRPLDSAFVKRRRRRRLLMAAAFLMGTSAVFAWGPGLLRPTLRRSAIRTARVDRGPIEAVITASGTVLPEVERVLSTPVDARVLRILKRPGSAVAPGDALVELDLSAARLAVEELDQQLALKLNQQGQTRLGLESRLVALDSQRQVKELSHRSLQAQLQRKQELHRRGLLSDQDLQAGELATAQAAIELKQTEDETAAARAATKAQIEGLVLEMATLRKQRAEAARRLSLGTMRADRAGVVTWTVNEEGAAVRSGDVVARLADLASFRLEATVSDLHAQRLGVGLPVVVKAGEASLQGTVSNVLPTIHDGALTFGVALAEKSHPALRSNLRVDVLVVLGRKPDALRLPRGPEIEGSGVQPLFVVRGGRALRREVRLGLMAFEACEVVDGLQEGDEVVLSNMAAYRHLAEVRIR